jgi:dephospho-CoA kinase
MVLPREFYEQLPSKTDEELYDIVYRQEGYLPEAVALAKEELKKRNLFDPERISEVSAIIHTKIESDNAVERAKAEEQLSWVQRILFFLFGAGIFGLVGVAYFERKGYKRKAKECWVIIGIHVGLVVILGLQR